MDSGKFLKFWNQAILFEKKKTLRIFEVGPSIVLWSDEETNSSMSSCADFVSWMDLSSLNVVNTFEYTKTSLHYAKRRIQCNVSDPKIKANFVICKRATGLEHALSKSLPRLDLRSSHTLQRFTTRQAICFSDFSLFRSKSGWICPRHAACVFPLTTSGIRPAVTDHTNSIMQFNYLNWISTSDFLGFECCGWPFKTRIQETQGACIGYSKVIDLRKEGNLRSSFKGFKGFNEGLKILQAKAPHAHDLEGHKQSPSPTNPFAWCMSNAKCFGNCFVHSRWSQPGMILAW